MSSRPAIVLVVLVVAIIAFCFAGVFAAMTGTYHLNFDLGNNTTADGGLFDNLTDLTSSDDSSSSDGGYVETYTDSGSSESSSSDVETTEDTSSSQQQSESYIPQDSQIVATDDNPNP
ncbi:MAG: hypothetical protein IJ104_08075 [Methanobrevibacter sp.]|nr:hypothetical protein [Methanobrevibacter sp.]